MFRSLLKVLILIVCVGCAGRSLEDCRQDGQSICRSILLELEAIETREELLDAKPRLARHFLHLVDVMIDAGELAEQEKLAAQPLSTDDRAMSDRLQRQLMRIYDMAGGREIIAEAQQEALFRLDAYQQKKGKGA